MHFVLKMRLVFKKPHMYVTYSKLDEMKPSKKSGSIHGSYIYTLVTTEHGAWNMDMVVNKAESTVL